MYKLVFLILALAGFLFYKANNLRVKRLPTKKTSVVKTSPVTKILVPTQKAVPIPMQPTPPIVAPVAKPESAQFDSLAEVFTEPDSIDIDRLTPEELAAHEANLAQMKRIEDDARREKSRLQSKPKSWESLTPEEKKSFEIYKKFENNGE